MRYLVVAALVVLVPEVAEAQVYVSAGDGTYRRSASLRQAYGYRQALAARLPAPAADSGPVYTLNYDYHALYEERLVTPEEIVETRIGFYGGGVAPTESRATTITPRR